MSDKDLFDSILGDIWSTTKKTSSSESDKYKTSDFLLDDILKEFGISEDKPKPEPQNHSSYADDFISNNSTGDIWANMFKDLSTEKTETKPKPVPIITEEVSRPEPIQAVPVQEPVKKTEPKQHTIARAVEPIKDPVIEQEKEQARNYVAELFGGNSPNAMTGTSAPVAEQPTIVADEPIVAPIRPIKKILSEREEENYKMRSGYIDLNAIREATAARNPIRPEEATQKFTSMNTEQRALFGKIGDFFSDATFQYDTSSVNNISAELINGRPRKQKNNVPENEDEIKINEQFEDIYDKKDIPAVEQELMFQVNIAGIKSIITAILTLPLALLNFFPGLIDSILPTVGTAYPVNHAIANLFILSIIAILNFNIIGKGIASLFRLRPTGSTLASLSVIASLSHCIYILIASEAITGMYCAVAALSVLFVLLGKYLYYKNVLKNFEILAFDTAKTACVNVAGGYSLKELYSDKERISACRSVDLITRFLSNSFDYNFADKTSRVSILSCIGILIVSVLAAILFNDAPSVFTLISAACCIVTPFCYDLAYSMPFYSVSSKIRKNGSAVVSYTRAGEFSKTSTMVLCDSDLFKPENIIVHSMKINGNDRINDVIINCASLLHESGSPVAGAFMNILDNKAEMLLPVYNFDWIPEKGVSGYINNVKYFIGSSQYLADCGIKLPSVDLEEKYKRAGRQVVMFADSTKLLAVFSISYCRDEQIFRNLHRINLGSLNLLVLTRDCNITSELMSQLYEMPVNNFTIASKNEFDRLYHKDDSKPKHPAGIYSITGATGITYALANCRRLMGTVRASVVMRTLALACGALILLLVGFTSGDIYSVITPARMALFHLLWMIPSLFISLFAG